MSKPEKQQKQQYAICTSYYTIETDINKHLKAGGKFIAQFKRRRDSDDHIIIFERTNDKHSTKEGRNGSST